jgi:hypothetical protein
VNLQETIIAIAHHGEREQRLGDVATEQGLNERAHVHYDRAKIAREGFLLVSAAEVSDPEYCYGVQELQVSATRYDLVKYGMLEPEPEGP